MRLSTFFFRPGLPSRLDAAETLPLANLFQRHSDFRFEHITL